MCVLLALVGCAQQSGSGNGSGSSGDVGSNNSTSSAASSATSGSASSASSSGGVETLDDQGGVEVFLDYNAGTGFEWECSVEPEGVLMITHQEAKSMTEGSTMAGGPLKDVVTLIALAPGDATLTCELRRSWETAEEPAEVQKFVFTVDADLQIHFDEDASSFVNLPEQIFFA